jgi:glycosyltransferase involved in cell wall biosynthesis
MKQMFDGSLFDLSSTNSVCWNAPQNSNVINTIIIYYNFGLRECLLLSLISASKISKDTEIILINDASEFNIENTEKNNVGILKYEIQVGQAKSIKKAIELARGKTIQIIDYDTIYEKNDIPNFNAELCCGKTIVKNGSENLREFAQGLIFKKDCIVNIINQIPDDFYSGIFEAIGYIAKQYDMEHTDNIITLCNNDISNRFYDKYETIEKNNIEKIKNCIEINNNFSKKKIIIMDNDISVSGSQWSSVLWGKGLKELGNDVCFLLYKGGNLTNYLRSNDIEYRIYDNNDKFSSWLLENVVGYKADIIDVAWNGDLITKEISNISKKCFYHLQSIKIPWFEKKDFYHNDHFIPVCHAIEKKYKNNFPFYTIHSPVDINTYLIKKNIRNISRSIFGFSDEDFVITWSGRISAKEKCANDLKYIASKLPNVKFALATIFSNINSYHRQIFIDGWKYWCSKNDSVLVDNLMPWNMAYFYACGDAYISISEIEGLSLATVEAGVSKLPLISTNVGGQCEFVIDEVNGKLIENKDSIVNAIQILTQTTREQRNVLGQYSFELANSLCDINTVTRKLYLAYGN